MYSLQILTGASVPSMFLAALGLLFPAFANAAFLYDFNDGNPLDSQGAGAEFDVSDGGVTLKLTSLEVKAPNYVDNGNGLEWDGITYVDSRTNVSGSLNALGVNNDSANFYSSEFQDFNPGEYWTFEFDLPVVFDEIDFASITESNGDSAIVTIEGMAPIQFDYTNLDASSDILDPFSGLVIPAGTNITFLGGGDPQDPAATSHWRITDFTVSVVPEPSALVMLLSIGAAVASLRRLR